MPSGARTIILCVVLVVIASSAHAVTISAGDLVTFPKENVAQGDVLAAGRQVIVRSKVEGDLTAAGGSVLAQGAVQGTALLAGNDVTLSGDVGNDAWLAGQNVRVASRVVDNIYLLGSTVTLDPGTRVGTDLLAAGNTINLLGDVGGSVRVAGNDVTIGGKVDGSVYVKAGGTVHLIQGAVIRGNFYYECAERASISHGARVLGKLTRSIPTNEKVKPLFWPRVAYSVGSILAAFLFGVVLVGIFPTGVQLTANTLRYSAWQSAGLGLAILFGVPLICLAGALTVIGLPVAASVFGLYLMALYAGPILTGLSIGQAILGWRSEEFARPVLSMILGVVILSLLRMVPFLGGVVAAAALLLGLGAICITWWHSRGFRLVRRQG